MKRALAFSLLPFALILAIGPVGCSDDDDNKDPITPPVIDEFELATSLGDTYFTNYTTPSGAPVNVSALTVYENLFVDGDTSNDPYILDWRSADAFNNAGHIEGAIRADITDFENVLNAIPAGKTVLNVCYTGQTASHVTAYMNMLGIEAQNLLLGMCGWTADTEVNLNKWGAAISNDLASWLETVTNTPSQVYDFPALDTGKTTAVEILREAAIDNLVANQFKTISVANLYNEMVTDPDKYFIVNYFTDTPYDAGHIPGAYQFVPKQSLGREQMLKYLPTDKTIVVYCYTGQTSSQVVAYLNALGYDARSLLYGVNAICHEDDVICPSPGPRYVDATQNYPVVTTP
ncbi:MAG: rhodanese-like domain-containing protein [Candidatus Eisenbacteria bacterium]